MTRILVGVLLILAFVSVPATVSVAQAPSDVIEAYIKLARQMKTCWFNYGRPVFPEHVFFADVPPDGKRVKITIHEKEDLGRPGKTSYVVYFRQQGRYTTVQTQNLAMPPEVAARMKFDIDRWRRGETACVKKVRADTSKTTKSATSKNGSQSTTDDEQSESGGEGRSALGRLWDRARGKTEEASP